jgi:hypothetical protein
VEAWLTASCESYRGLAIGSAIRPPESGKAAPNPSGNILRPDAASDTVFVMSESPESRLDDPRLLEAIKRRDNALMERDKYDLEAEEWSEWIRKYHLLTPVPPPKDLNDCASDLIGNGAPAENQTTKQSPEVRETLATAKQIIQERGVPVSTADLYREFLHRRVSLSGKSPKATLDGRLRYAANEFLVVPGRGWWPRNSGDPVPNGSAAGIHETPAAQGNRL